MSDVEVPSLGEDIREAAVLKVLVSEGDRVEKDQPLLELETDKTTFELPCPFAGTVQSVSVSEGDSVSPGQSVLRVDEGDGTGAGADDEATEQEGEEKNKPRRRKKKTAGTPRGREEEEDGQNESADAEKTREAGSDADTAAPEPAAKDESGEEATAGGDGDAGGGARSPRADDEAEAHEREEDTRERPASAGTAAPAASEPAGGAPPATAAGDAVAAAPATRRLARELGVDLTAVRGSGAGNRITQSDVKAHVRRSRDAREAGSDGAAPAAPDDGRWGPSERQRLNGIRRATARRLAASWPAVPQVTHHERADVTELERSRRRHEDRRDEDEPRLTLTALVVKASAAALRAFPRLNASLDMENEELIVKGWVSVGVAVDTEAGLLVPVVRDADRRPLGEIAADLAELSARARRRELDAEAMEGGTFTVTSLGGIGGVAFTPLVNPPQVAILGVSRAREEPALREGSLENRLWLPLSLSYDHRAIDGAEAARFCAWLARRLSDPLQLLMGA